MKALRSLKNKFRGKAEPTSERSVPFPAPTLLQNAPLHNHLPTPGSISPQKPSILDILPMEIMEAIVSLVSPSLLLPALR